MPRWTRAPSLFARLRQSAAATPFSSFFSSHSSFTFFSFASPPATTRMRRGGGTGFRCSTAALAVVGILIAASVVVDCSDDDPQAKLSCSRTCVAENCNSMGIRYGKYCGVGWSGCPGEKPCDDLDACCKVHDECVEKKGMTNIKCHEKFKTCIKKVQKSGKVGFSRDCPYQTAVPTMVQGMDMAILLSQFGNSKLEL